LAREVKEEGLIVGVGLAIEDGFVSWQAVRARQLRIKAQRNAKRDRGGMNLRGIGGLGKEWLAMGSPP
jgi:hypothetical protein